MAGLCACLLAGLLQIPDARAERDVVLVHGFLSNGRDLATLRSSLERSGWRVHQFDYRPSDGRVAIGELAARLKTFIGQELPDGATFALVGFSMGGIVGHWYVEKLGGHTRVSHLVTIGSPHRGTLFAFLGITRGVRDLQPGSRVLRSLATVPRVPMTTVWTPLDLMIFPSWNSKITGAESHTVWNLAHPLLLEDPRVFRVTMNAIDRPPAESRDGSKSAP